ncbi:Uncharacterised protein [Klebsiella variicola]|nr:MULTISPECIES: hypothetical protein [Klebsiella]SWC31333.1 Uncharacterised protein [Klebsiella pneumoniae]SXF43122.1 Uncharacterised protein [Klebsiella variicola]
MSDFNIASKSKDEQDKAMLTLRSPALHAKCALVSFGRKEDKRWYRF